MALRTISLCAGIGGIDLGLAEWSRAVCYVEQEAFAASVLVARMEDSSLDCAPIWDDLTTFDGGAWRGAVDLVTGGYPCQPFSFAGARRGADDERHLWLHVRRILEECGAPLAFFENVPGHISLGLPDVLADLAALGFDAEWTCNSASDFGDSMEGERLFILAARNGARRPGGRAGDEGEEVGSPDRPRLEERRSETFTGAFPAAWPPGPSDRDGWERWVAASGPQPVLRRGVDGPAAFVDRSDRLRALGNAVVPAQARAAFLKLAERLR